MLAALFFSARCHFEVTKDNINGFINASYPKDIFFLMFSPWCSHCNMFKGTWDSLSQSCGSSYVLAQANCIEQPNVCNRFNVEYYPYIFIYRTRNGEIIPFSGARDINNIENFLKKHSTPSVITINNNQLESVVSFIECQTVFVLFYQENQTIANDYSQLALGKLFNKGRYYLILSNETRLTAYKSKKYFKSLNDSLDKHSIQQFIENNHISLFPKLTHSLLAYFYSQSQPIFVFIFNNNEKYSIYQQYVDELSSKKQYCYINKTTEKELLGVFDENIFNGILYYNTLNKVFQMYNGSYTFDSIKDWIDNIELYDGIWYKANQQRSPIISIIFVICFVFGLVYSFYRLCFHTSKKSQPLLDIDFE